jgi:3-oxoacyl-[acyl-carrier protein] reductase
LTFGAQYRDGLGSDISQSRVLGKNDLLRRRIWLLQRRFFMKQQRSGKIITVSSVAGTAPSADGGYAHYGAAKAAIAHYTRNLAQDLGPFGIAANCIAPGVIATGRIMQTIIPASMQSNRYRSELVALRRLGTVEDCAKVVEFLVMDCLLGLHAVASGVRNRSQNGSLLTPATRSISGT